MIRALPLAFALAATAPAVAADSLAANLALPIASGLTGARAVARFAWVETAAGVRNLWVADRGQPARALTAFTADDGQEIYDLALSDDGGRIASVRGGDAEFPEGAAPNPAGLAEPPGQHLFVAPAQGGAPVEVGEGHAPVFSPDGATLAFTRKGAIWLWRDGTSARRVASVPGSVERLTWSPDGTRLMFLSERGDHGFVVLLDLAAGTLRYLDPALGHAAEPAFAPDGQRIAFVQYVDPPADAPAGEGAYWSIRVADVASGAVRTLWQAPPGPGGRFAGTRGINLFWTATGRIVYPWERSGWLHPYAVDAAEGGEPIELTPGAFEVDSFVPTPDGKALVYAANPGDLDHRHLYRVGIDGGRAAPLTGGAGAETYPLFGGDALAVTASDVSHPAYPALVERRMTALRPPIAASGLVTPELVTFRAEDGVEVHGQLFRAKGPGRHPALVFVHGGPRRQMLPGFHPSNYYSNAYVLNQHFAGEGYDVLSINYRSGTGYGLAFRDAPGIARGGASEYRDVIAAGRWLAARPEVDPARIGIWGGSWGGYLTALALARNSDLFRAGADFHGVHSMLRPVEQTLSPDAQSAARALQWESSPLASIDRWRSPVLLIHGDDDHNVDFSQSLVLARELKARGVAMRERVFPGERHGFLRYADWLAAYRATDDFFRETLLAPPQAR